MLKRIWYIFGPIIISLLLILALLLFAPSKATHRLYDEKRAATALTPIVFKNAALKKEALSDHNHRFVPFFGSSEWRRLDTMHPSVLSEAYDREYRPFLLGLQGAESLTHYFGMQQIKAELKHKQAVFVISPQWFIKSGQNRGAFNFYYSNDQGYRFLEYATNTAEDRYAAKRFMKMSPSSPLTKFMEKISRGESLNQLELYQIKFQKKLAVHEDNLFARLQFGDNYQKFVKPRAASLPQPYSEAALDDKATKLAKLHTNNNSFEILNSFYTMRIKHKLPQLKNSQINFSYLQSPEYNDLQLVLSEFAKNKTDVMFVIPPVNGKWQAFSGLSEEMYNKTVEKIRYQLSSQGFTHIADLSKRGNEPYFMQDTIHLGWHGWLAFDREVTPFLTTKQAPPTYQLNNYFLTPNWASKKDNFE